MEMVEHVSPMMMNLQKKLEEYLFMVRRKDITIPKLVLMVD